jgi:hypothetical protein
MAQIKNPLDEVRIPFAKMTFTPDVPSTALNPNEYNDGLNVETDVRGIRSMSGDQEILDSLPAGSGAPTFITGGFRNDGYFWFVVATQADPIDPVTYPGQYLAYNYTTQTWDDITPTDLNFNSEGYNQATNITEAWNGNVLFLNDEQNPPMFWPAEPGSVLVSYSNQVPLDIFDIQTPTLTEKLVVFNEVQSQAPFAVGSFVLITEVLPRYYNGTWLVTACTTTDVTIECEVTDAYSSGGVVAPAYTWNYNPEWASVFAKFMRIYNTPNVGSILVAGNLTATPTVQITGDTTTTSTTLTSIGIAANMVNGVITGPGIPANTTVVSVNPGVDMVLSNAATTSETAALFNIALDTTEIYPVTVQWSQAFGLNQAPTTWTPTVTNIANQLEVPLRGPALDAFPCNGQFFLCSYWDTVVFSPINYSTTAAPILGVRQYNQGRGLLSSNCWANTDKLVYGVDARDIWVFDGQDFQGLGNQRVKNWFYDRLDPRYYDRVFLEINSQRSQIEIYYTDRDKVVDDGVPDKMISYRYDIDCWNSPRDVSDATFATESPIWLYDDVTPEWYSADGSRTVVYARGIAESNIVMKDQGFEYLGGAPIESYFRRDNIKLLKDYSGKLMVHRILPEVVNLGADPFTDDDERPVDPATSTNKGNITVTIKGANSVGSAPSDRNGGIIAVTIPIDADGSQNKNPWAQINQNAFRVNTLELSNSSNNSVWMCSATTWQVTQVEDDR